jgi:class 3 adenylate cyclase
MLALITLAGGLYNLGVARESRVAGICGAILGGGYWAIRAVFLFLLAAKVHVEAMVLIPFTFGGAFCGIAVHRWFQKSRTKLGLKDPAAERQLMLEQLVSLQEKLRSGEQSFTFVSVDIVGSTRMKERSDPLSVEFTFNEYHQFVERIVKRYGGRIHSTAGDGVTAAFEHPQSGFGASRTIQAGVIELNTHRNKIGVPIVLRVGVHTGTVVAPDATDITKLNFAHVIDIAAHMQKCCPPGGVAVSDAASVYLHGGPDTVGLEAFEVDGIKGRIWQPKTIVGPTATPVPPPIPG